MKLDFNDKVIMKNSDVAKYAFVTITEQEYIYLDGCLDLYHSGKLTNEAFTKIFEHQPLAFVLHGNTSEVDSKTIAPYIECCSVKETESSHARDSYKCFCGEPFLLDYKTTVLHATPLDAWKCLMTFCKNPKFGVVINLKYI